MSWTEWRPPSIPKSQRDQDKVTVSASAKGARFAQVLRITVKARLLSDAPEFLRTGALVAVAVGGGEHAGMLRLSPGAAGDLKIGSSAGTSGKSGSVSIVLPGWSPLPAEKRKREAVDYEYGDAWLEVTLPGWARPIAPASPSATKAAGAAGSKPFVGAATGVPASAFAGMRGGR